MEDWQTTPAIDEERKLEILKEKAKKEKILKELGSVKMRKMEDNLRKKQTLKISMPIVTELLTCTAWQPFPYGRLWPSRILSFTKPQPLSRSTEAEAAANTRPEDVVPIARLDHFRALKSDGQIRVF